MQTGGSAYEPLGAIHHKEVRLSIVSNAKEIAELVKKLGNIDLYRKIIDLEGEIVDLSGENHSLKQQNQDLSQKLQVRERLKFDGKVYWLEEDGKKDGPFCQRCYDVDTKLVRLQSGAADDYDAESNQVYRDAIKYRHCLQCKASYQSA